MKKKTNKTKKIIKGVAVAGAIAGAAYMLLGPDGKKNQAKLKKFAGKVKTEIKKNVKVAVKGAKVLKKEAMKDAKEVKKMVAKNLKEVKKMK